MILRVKLKEILDDRKITQKQLHEMTGIRTAAISELYNNQRKTINREHLTKIATALEIKDVTELIELRDSAQ